MANETVLTIVGNLTADPELRYTSAGVAYAKFTVASTPRTLDKQSGQWRDAEPLFLACTAWRDLAEHTAESLTRGARVIVTGRLRLNRWETPAGDKRSQHVLDADDVAASLRFAAVTVKKLTRTSAGTADPAGDQWTTGADSAPAMAGRNTEPPF